MELTYYCDEKRHLICKPYSKENLHKMAEDLGIKRCWFHKNHYDIPKLRIKEITEKCTVVTSQEIVLIIKCPGGGMVDTLDSKPSVERRESSSLSLGTKNLKMESKDGLPDDYNDILPEETVDLNKWLFNHHTHAEIVYDTCSGCIVYKKEDVYELIKLLRENKI